MLNTDNDLFPLSQISGTQGHASSLRSPGLVDRRGSTRGCRQPPPTPTHPPTPCTKQLLPVTPLLLGLRSQKSASKTKPQ